MKSKGFVNQLNNLFNSTLLPADASTEEVIEFLLDVFLNTKDNMQDWDMLPELDIFHSDGKND